MPSNLRMRRRAAIAVGIILLITTLAALWILPWRLAHDSGGSYYTFNLICDETAYAVKIQASMEGTTPLNPVNGITDPRVVSQFYLEDFCHLLLSASGLHVITFFWIWRLLFPIFLCVTVFILARVCLPSRRRLWNVPLMLAGGAAAFALLYALDALLLPAPPFHWLNRIPTNIEFPLSVVVLAAFIYFLKKTTQVRANALVAALLLTAYLRPYAAVPWMFSIFLIVIWMALTRQIGWRIVGIAIAILFGG